MFLSLEGVLIGLAFVTAAFVVGVISSARKRREEARRTPLVVVRRRHDSSVGSGR
jgi:hypothetical protein